MCDKNGRVLLTLSEVGTEVRKYHAPYSIVETTRYPLPNEIPCLVCLDERLVGVDVWNVSERVSLHYTLKFNELYLKADSKV